MKTIYVPTINDSQFDYVRLFQIWDEVGITQDDVRFDFSRCKFLRPNAVAFLGGVARLAQLRQHTVEFDWSTISAPILANLCQSGFAQNFGHTSSGWVGHSIPYREDRLSDAASVSDYLGEQWIGRGWVHVSEDLRNAIVGNVWEIYANSFEHSGSPVGVFSCGQHFDAIDELVLSVVDFGSGIPNKVRSYLSSDPRSKGLRSSACMGWAFQRGNTTSQLGVARGLGLDLLKEFVRVNDGSLEVYSNEGYAIVDRAGERYQDLSAGFNGTAVQIRLKCDERLYALFRN